MIKSIWSIGEDGSNLGYNVYLDEEAYDKIVASLSDSDRAIFDEEEYGGNIFVMEEDNVMVDWKAVTDEATSYAVEGTYEDVLKTVNDVIAEHKSYGC